jgi:hypothetical protein
METRQVRDRHRTAAPPTSARSLRGVIDRLDLRDDGGPWSSTTGRAPSINWEQQRPAGVPLPLPLREQVLGRRPAVIS